MINYYDKIKTELVNNEIYKKVKDYSKNRNDLNTYYNVGKLLNEAGKHYGEAIIKKYSLQLTNELGKKYSITSLKYMRQFYILQKSQPLADQLSWSHYIELLPLKDTNKMNYYINISISQNLSRNELRDRIKSKEYERLDDKTKNKLIKKEKTNVSDFIKNPIIIKNKNKIDIDKVSEKILKELIMEDIDNFLCELGDGFTYVGNEYKIKIGNRYHYIDILLFNIIYNSYVVIELKVTELKSSYIGQIQEYINYIDRNKKLNIHNKTIGVIIVRKDNKFVMEYVTDNRIFSKEYILK